MSHRAWYLVLSVAFLASTYAYGNPINRETSRRYFIDAEKAAAAGDLQAAKIGYSRALLNGRLGDIPPAVEAVVGQKLAQVLGNLCEREEAEKIFLEAIAAAEKAAGAESPRTFPLRAELAQFTFDTDQFDKAVGYFEKAFSVGEVVLTEKQPVAMAQVLDDYATALERSGQANKAEEARRKAAGLRERGGESTVLRKNYVPYPKTCK
jgi:tetratricopeptide (TPR) repeat protein